MRLLNKFTVFNHKIIKIDFFFINFLHLSLQTNNRKSIPCRKLIQAQWDGNQSSPNLDINRWRYVMNPLRRQPWEPAYIHTTRLEYNIEERSQEKELICHNLVTTAGNNLFGQKEG